MNENTLFGSSKAATTLTKELNELKNKKISTKAYRYCANFSHYLNHLEKTDYRTKLVCAKLLKNQITESIKDNWEWPGNIRTLLLNVINSIYKDHTYYTISYRNKKETFGICDSCKKLADVQYKFKTHTLRFCKNHRP